jgi:hypothetical protein
MHQEYDASRTCIENTLLCARAIFPTSHVLVGVHIHFDHKQSPSCLTALALLLVLLVLLVHHENGPGAKVKPQRGFFAAPWMVSNSIWAIASPCAPFAATKSCV